MSFSQNCVGLQWAWCIPQFTRSEGPWELCIAWSHRDISQKKLLEWSCWRPSPLQHVTGKVLIHNFPKLFLIEDKQGMSICLGAKSMGVRCFYFLFFLFCFFLWILEERSQGEGFFFLFVSKNKIINKYVCIKKKW